MRYSPQAIGAGRSNRRCYGIRTLRGKSLPFPGGALSVRGGVYTGTELSTTATMRTQPRILTNPAPPIHRLSELVNGVGEPVAAGDRQIKIAVSATWRACPAERMNLDEKAVQSLRAAVAAGDG